MKSNYSCEMLVHTPLCTHKEPKKVLIISKDSFEIEKELKKHYEISYESVNKDELNFLQNEKNDTYDIALINIENKNKVFFAHLRRVLKEDAVISLIINDIQDKEIYKVLSDNFKIIMPYSYEKEFLILASNIYHPTADLILQRSDLIEDLEYYNTELHSASFALPTYIKKNLKGYIKN